MPITIRKPVGIAKTLTVADKNKKTVKVDVSGYLIYTARPWRIGRKIGKHAARLSAVLLRDLKLVAPGVSKAVLPHKVQGVALKLTYTPIAAEGAEGAEEKTRTKDFTRGPGRPCVRADSLINPRAVRIAGGWRLE